MSNVTSLSTFAEHTEITFGKDRVRRDRVLEVQSDRRRPQGIASISDGLLPTLFMLRHTGFFQGIDQEWNMCQSINNHRPRPGKPEGNFPGVEIRSALHMDIRDAFHRECQRGDINTYGLWDFDLTSSLRHLFNDIMPPILQDMVDYGYRGRAVVTACCRSDGFRSEEDRSNYIRSFLPNGIEYIRSDSYSSNYYDRHRVYHRRPPMCQFILRGIKMYGGKPARSSGR
jgi:hypothetical protein